MVYTLQNNGNDKERRAFASFLKNQFPSYEVFWQKFIIPLTNRPNDIYFGSDEDLKTKFAGETDTIIHERICIAQLHYSVCRFLLEAFDSIENTDKNISEVERCFSCLYSALDISSELFARYNRIKNELVSVDAFSFQSIRDSKKLREQWNKQNKFPIHIQKIRNYRNILVHGRLLPILQSPMANFIFLPKLGSEHLYFDWRNITDHNLNYSNLIFGNILAKEAFEITIKFLEECWQKYLLK